MYKTEDLRALLVDVAHERRDLQLRQQELRALVQTRERDIPRRLAQIATALAGLHNTMKTHFARRESGGVIVEAVVRLPRLAEEAAAIEHEHPALLQETETLCHTVQTSEHCPAGWRHVCAAVERLLRHLKSHETAENRLLSEGFNEDIDSLI